jgi:hypothetical protein
MPIAPRQTTHVETLGGGERLAVVQGLDRGENVDVALDELGDLDKELAALEARAVEAPGGVEGLVGGVKGELDIGGQTLRDRGDRLAGGGVDNAVVATSRVWKGSRGSCGTGWKIREEDVPKQRAHWNRCRVGRKRSHRQPGPCLLETPGGGQQAAGSRHMEKETSSTHSIVFALLSLDSAHSPLMNRPVGISTVPL